MKVTIVVCAYTALRWDDIVAGAAEARRQLDASPHDGEVVLVVDHNPELAQRVRDEMANVTVIENSRTRGLSGARNTAILAVQTDVVVFLDDDAVPAPGWLDALLSPFADEAVIITGGAATPRWPDGGRPATLPAADGGRGELDWVIGCTYAGQPTSGAPVRNVMGCSMAWRAHVFARAGLFGEDLGRVGTVPYGCEETELCIRAATAGSVVWFAPDSLVLHRVTTARTTWSYLWNRCYAEGISKAAVAVRTTQGQALATESVYATRVLPRGVARELASVSRRPRRSLAGAAAIVTGLTVTMVGYVVGRVSIRVARTKGENR